MPDDPIDEALKLQNFLFGGLSRTFDEHNIPPTMATMMLTQMIGELIVKHTDTAEERHEASQAVVTTLLEHINPNQGHEGGTA